MLTATLHLTVARHYCDGNLAAIKLSFSGELASCGMKECAEKDCHQTGEQLIKHCCDNYITFNVIDSNYNPSFPIEIVFCQYNFQDFNIPLELPILPSKVLTSLYINVRPTNTPWFTSVDLSDICVFRI